jgi:hypothetical protein
MAVNIGLRVINRETAIVNIKEGFINITESKEGWKRKATSSAS